MTSIKKTAEVPYTITEMQDLICKIEDYPKFLSWCRGAQVQSRTPQKIQANLQGEKWGIHFNIGLIYQIQSQNRITIFLLQTGPFKYIKSLWRLASLEKGGCQFSFELEYEFSRALFNWTFTPLIKAESNNLIRSFKEQAKMVYGDRK